MSARRSKGEGTLYFREDRQRWVAQITLPNGLRRSKTSETQKEARDWLIKQRNLANEGLFVADNQIKLRDFLEQYLSNVAIHKLRPRTYERNVSIIRNHINPGIGNIKLNALRADQIQQFYAQKLAEGATKSTVKYIHVILHKCLKQAFKWGLVSRNVAELVEVPKPAKKTFHTWTTHEVAEFLAAVKDHRWYLVYVIAIYCGLRQGEILGIRRRDIDLERGIIHVRRQVTYITGKGLVLTEPKTEKAKRPVTVPATTLALLEQYVEEIEDRDELIFTTSTGKPVSPRNVIRHFKQVIEQVGLPDIRFHDLRHTHATLLLAAGVHPKVVQERLGHSQISLTLDTYSHVIPSLQTEAAEQFDALMP